MAVLEERNPKQESAALVIAQILADPENRQLADVSKISIRMRHPLTMLRSLIEQTDVFVEQIKARQKWQVARYVRQQALLEKRRINYYTSLRNSKKSEDEKKKIYIPQQIWTDEYQIAYLSKAEKDIDDDSSFKKDKMFAMDFFLQYCHIARGTEGFIANLLQVLADSEITNRSADENASTSSARGS